MIFKEMTTKAGKYIQYQLIDFNGYVYWAKLGNSRFAVDSQCEQQFLETMDMLNGGGIE